MLHGSSTHYIDLKDAYYHVPIHRRYRKFLSFRVDDEKFQFTQMPFGLAIAPRVFTKLISVVVSALALKGVRILPYLDDWLVWADTESSCHNMVLATLREIQFRGLDVNLPKSHFVPCQRLQWLGLVWDSSLATISLPLDKQIKIQDAVRSFKELGSSSWGSSTSPLRSTR